MDPALANLGWTDEQWNRICTTVTEEAHKARVAAQVLPVVGPEDASTLAIPRFTLDTQGLQAPQPGSPTERLRVDSNPTLNLTTISVNVPLRGHEMADPDLRAALTMFRRAANYIARLEDAIAFTGRTAGPHPLLGAGDIGVPPVFSLSTDATMFDPGILNGTALYVVLPRTPDPNKSVVAGRDLVSGVIKAIGQLERNGHLGPFACILGDLLFDAAHDPNDNFVLPRDRILPEIRGPLVRTSTMDRMMGALVALSGNPVELVVGSDIHVQYLQTTLEPRYVFRVVERIALRLKEANAITTFLVAD